MKALIVEKEVRMASILEETGGVFSYREAHEISDAETMIGAGDYQLLIMDCNLPELSCLSLVKKLRKKRTSDGPHIEGFSGCPYIIVVGCPNEEVAINTFISAGADDAVSSPVCRHELKRSINIAQRILTLNNSLVSAYVEMMEVDKTAVIGRLVPGIAHEINNPLGFVDSNLAVLSDYCHNLCEAVNHNCKNTGQDGNSASAQEDAFRNIDTIQADLFPLLEECRVGIGRIKKLIRDLQQVSRKDAGPETDIDINNCLDETLGVLCNELKYKAVVNKSYGHLSPVSGYSGGLHQVFLHILNEAAQLIESKGVIEINTANGNGFVSISISSSGNNDRLRQSTDNENACGGHNEFTRALSAARTTIQAHGGFLEIERSRDTGTMFRVRLPVKQVYNNDNFDSGGGYHE